uniref:Photosystem I P700 chlorophyll a apoprotein A2 n=1 Tax=Chlamydomonas reinhardtii TaxID=3055 RepID=UPI002249A2AB|nr:Chain B2, Photosystem I P700 chlorophyll a apoprotein A2 [Chlamydomonas reinhardtii]
TKLFPKFSQGLAQDPTTRRIWYGLAMAHDFESHDGMTEENLYQKIFASHFGQLSIIFLWTSGNLFHVAWQGNFEQIAHAIWDPHFGQPAVEAFTRGPVNIGMRTNQDLYVGSVFLALVSAIFLFAGWLHLQPNFQPSLSWFWTGHLVHVAIPHVGWDNFLSVLPHEKTPLANLVYWKDKP